MREGHIEPRGEQVLRDPISNGRSKITALLRVTGQLRHGHAECGMRFLLSHHCSSHSLSISALSLSCSICSMGPLFGLAAPVLKTKMVWCDGLLLRQTIATLGRRPRGFGGSGTAPVPSNSITCLYSGCTPQKFSLFAPRRHDYRNSLVAARN